MKKICTNIIWTMLVCLLGVTPATAATTVNGATAATVPGTVLLKNIKVYDGVQIKSDDLLFDYADGTNGYVLFDVLPAVTGKYTFKARVATGTGVSRYCQLGPVDANGKFVGTVPRMEVPGGTDNNDWTKNIVTRSWEYELTAGETTTFKVTYDKAGQTFGINLYTIEVTSDADGDYNVLYYNEAYTTADATYTLFIKQPYAEGTAVALPTTEPKAPEGMMFNGWATADGQPFTNGMPACSAEVYPTWAESVWNVNRLSSLPVKYITKWNKCTAKGSQLIDSSYDGSYILFDVCADATGYYQFTSSIGTKLDGIHCALGYINAKGSYIEADTLDIENNNSWSNGRDYKWLFKLEEGQTYTFKMLCFTPGGYCLNAYDLRVAEFVPNTKVPYMWVDGMRFYPRNDVYNINLAAGIKHTVVPMTASSLAEVDYKAVCDGMPVPVSSDGTVDCTALKNGQVVDLTVTVTDGPESADYALKLNMGDMMYREFRGLTADNGIWTSSYNYSLVQEWTDNVCTLVPTKESKRFSNGYWTPAGSQMIYGFCTQNATVALNVPDAYEVHAVSFIGHIFNGKSTTLGVSSEGATVTASQESLPATATEQYMDCATFTIEGHKAGTPLVVTVDGGQANLYVRIMYRPVGDSSMPVLKDQNIAEGTTLETPNGCVSLRFNEQIRWIDGVKALFDGRTVEPKIEDNVYVNYYFWGMDYNSTHTFILPAGSIGDESGNELTTDITVNFSIGDRPAVKKKVYDFVVGVDGTIDQAIAAANKTSGTGRYHIFVPDGKYELSGNSGDHMTDVTRSNLSITGQSMDGAIICNTPETYGISNTATLHLKYTSGIYMQDITLRNNRGADKTNGPRAGQQVALYDRGEKSILHRVKLESFQDTYVSGHRAFFNQCDIYGGTDYICGGGDVFFNECNLYSWTTGNVIVAPATNASQKWGYVFQYCTLYGKNYTLGRPWQGVPRAYFLNSRMETAPTGTGWRDMGTLETHFYEYNSMDLSGKKLDLSKRGNSPTSTNKYTPVLTDEQAKEFTLYNVLCGTDGWVPTLYTQQTDVPEVTVVDGVASWTLADDAMCMVIFLNGKYVTATTGNSYKLEADGEYIFRMANEMGGLGSPFTYTSIAGVEQMEVQPVSTSVSGDRLSLSGLPVGCIVELHTSTGALLHRSVASGSVTDLPLAAGLNIVHITCNRTVQVLKVINR